MVDWLKKAPTSITIAVIIVCGFLAFGVLAGYVVLLALGVDTTPYRQFIQTVGQLMVYPFIGTTAVASIQAARSSSKAEDNTNGNLTALHDEVKELRALLAQKDGTNG